MAQATEQEARAFYAGSEAAALDVSVVMGAAARTVAALAPPPAVADPNYDAAVRDAELLIGRYIWRTEASALAGKSISGVSSKSYADSTKVQDLIRATMGSYSSSGSIQTIGLTRSL